MRVGVLALQGAARAHVEAFARLGVRAELVRSLAALEELTHLVLPGGESTTLAHLLELFGMTARIRARFLAGELRLMGTCAGAILLARDEGSAPRRMGLLDVSAERNAHGPQLHSTRRSIALRLPRERDQPEPRELEAVFIRAPRLHSAGAGVRVLAREGEELLAVESSGILATSFHPELTTELALHARFLSSAPLRVAVAHA